MMLKREVEKLKGSLHIPYLSVSDVYPDDDGSLRRMVDVQVDEHDTLVDIRRMCSKIASQFEGSFTGEMRIDGDALTFIISYDTYVDPPPPWKVFREDPL